MIAGTAAFARYLRGTRDARLTREMREMVGVKLDRGFAAHRRGQEQGL